MTMYTHQLEVELFQVSGVLQQMLYRLLHVCVGHQLLLPELGEIDNATQVSSKPI